MSYAVIGEWLTESVDGCTCAGGGEWPHESHCGYEPLAKISELEAAISAVQRVRELHRPLADSVSALYPEPQCAECHENHPCPTIQALDAT